MSSFNISVRSGLKTAFCLLVSATFSLPLTALDSAIGDEIINHLEFLGYTVEVAENRVLATASNEANIYIEDYAEGLLCFTYYPLDRSVPLEALAEHINQLNSSAVLCRHYIDVNHNLRVEFWTPPLYDRLVFGKMFRLWQDETRDYIYVSGISDYIVE